MQDHEVDAGLAVPAFGEGEEHGNVAGSGQQEEDSIENGFDPGFVREGEKVGVAEGEVAVIEEAGVVGELWISWIG